MAAGFIRYSFFFMKQPWLLKQKSSLLWKSKLLTLSLFGLIIIKSRTFLRYICGSHPGSPPMPAGKSW